MSEIPKTSTEQPATAGQSLPQAPQEPAAPKRKKSLLRTLVKIAAIFAILIVVLILCVPFIVSSDMVREKVEKDLTSMLGAETTLASHDFGWFSGLKLNGLEVANPEGFPKDQKALKLSALAGDISLLDLIWGKLRISGKINGLEVRVYEKADGTTNLAKLFGTEDDPKKTDKKSGDPDEDPAGGGSDLNRVNLDLVIANSLIEIVHEERGVVEKLREIDAEIKKPYDSTTAKLVLNAKLQRDSDPTPGRLALMADVDTSFENPTEAKLETTGLDLSRYRSLLNSLMEPADRPTEFAGLLEGDLQATYRHEQSVKLAGDMTITNPRFAGGLFGDIKIASAKWHLKPAVDAVVDAAFNVKSVSVDGFDLDFSFLRLRGMDAAAARQSSVGRPALGLTFDVDLGQLARMGVAGLEGLQAGTGNLKGGVTLATDWGDMKPEDLATRWSEFVRATATVGVDGYTVDGFELKNLSGQLNVADAVAKFGSVPGATLSGGPIDLTVEAPVDLSDKQPAKITIDWKGGMIGGNAVPLLRYVLPFLAGLDTQNTSAIQLSSKAGVKMVLTGPALPKEGEATLAWFERWSGSGDLALADGRFTPAAAWQTVLQFAGAKVPLEFQNIATAFDLKQGSISSEQLRLSRRTSSWSLKGSTTLAGKMNYSIDLRGLIAEHKDGEKLLKHLGNTPLTANLTGTLDAPKLAAPSYTDLVTQALKSSAQGALEKGLKDLFKRKK